MHFIVMAIFLLSFSSNALAEQFRNHLTLKEAEKLCIENNLLIKAKRAEITKADADIISAKIIPNPSLKYAIDSLRNSERETEETYSFSQNIDISRKRSMRIDAAKKSKEARLYFLKQEISDVIFNLKQTYYKILFLKENEKLLTALFEMFEDVKKKTEERFTAGDISEAEFMKISSEQRSIKRSLDALRIELRAEKKKLGLILNLSETDLEPIEDFVYKPLPPDLNITPESIILQRPDIKGQDMFVEVANSSVILAKRDSIPSFDIEAGYKKRTGGFQGFIFGLTIPLPIFDRNQGGIERAKGELEQERVTLELMKKNALNEISVLKEKIDSLSKIISETSQQLDITRQLTKIARIAYEEGEMSLLELLDAVRAEKTLSMEYNESLYAYWVSVFELQKATGKIFYDFNNRGEK